MKLLRKLIFERRFPYLLYLIEELLLEVNDRNSERIEKDSQFLVISGTQRTLERVRGMAVVVRIAQYQGTNQPQPSDLSSPSSPDFPCRLREFS